MFMLGGMEVLIITMFYAGLGLPLGVPPAEPDPLMQRIAPDECIYYTTWAGMAKPDPQSGNPTEALMAEEEVQQFVQHLDKALTEGFPRLARPSGGAEALLAENASLWAKTLITHSTAIYVSKFEVKQGGPPDIAAGAIINTGDDTAKIRDGLLELQKQAGDDLEVNEVEIAGATFYRFQPDPSAPEITWGVRGKYLLLGVGEGTVEAMFANARTAPPKWLTQLQEELPVERTSTVTYANMNELVKQSLNGLQGNDQEQAKEWLAALGLNNVTSYVSVTGLDEDGFVNRTVMNIEGESRGIFALADAKPLTADDLQTIPADSTIAFGLRLDGQKVLEKVQETVREADPDMARQMDEGLDEINEMLGLDLRGELLASLGDNWCIYNSADEGGLLFSGLTATVDLRDPAKARKVHAQLMALAEAGLKPPEGEEFGYYAPPQLKTIELQGRTIHFLSVVDTEFPFAPAWCLTDKHLIVSLFPQNIQAMLVRGEDFKSVATIPEVTKALAAEPGPLSVTYVDTKTLFEMVYPIAQIAATALLNNLAEEGIEIDASILPRSETISRHLRPSITSITRSEAGIEFTARQSLPGGSMGSTAPIAVAALLPAIQSARTAARRMQSMNNLKQIALAMHNHHAAMRRLPAAAMKTEDGKPGLSWRVKILPYIEGGGLYDEFRHDEPWDSEHNKALIARIPAVYRSPASAAPEGYTTYLGVAGEDGLFSGEEGARFAEIRDGLSNTLMVVEVNDRAAVPWTKPADFDPDEGMKPTEKLSGVWPGVFQAAMGDGSVHAISTSLAPAKLKALFTKAGGEVVDWHDLDGHDHHHHEGDAAVPDAFEEEPEAFERLDDLEFEPEAEAVP